MNTYDLLLSSRIAAVYRMDSLGTVMSVNSGDNETIIDWDAWNADTESGDIDTHTEDNWEFVEEEE